MKTGSFYSNLTRQWRVVSTGLGLFVCAITVSGAEKTNPTTAPALLTTNVGAKLSAVVIPTSQFAIPTSSVEGRNPFFPESTLTNFRQSSPTNTTSKVSAVALTLQGISGRFALINGRTFAEGEDGDVTVGRSKVHIQCLKIKEDGVTIEVDGTRRELKLRPGL